MSGGSGDATTRGGSGDLSLDDLMALNDEIVGLVRAGLPLEAGLTGAGRDLRGRLGTITTALADHLRRGDSLTEALDAERGAIPPVYRTVVEAGLRVGKPATALEGLADYAQRYTETRREIGLALVYPVIVAVMAYALFVGFVMLAAPRFAAAFEQLRVPGRSAVAGLAWLGQSAAYWGPVVPIVVLLLVAAWYASGRSSGFGPGRWQSVLGRFPGFGGLLAMARTANFADLLALLLESGVPLADAVELSAGSTGDPRMRREAGVVAEGLRRGEPTSEALAAVGDPRGTRRRRSSFPPILCWLMAVGEHRGEIAPALRHAARSYRRRANLRAQWIRAVLPTVLVMVVGVSAVALYALVLFVPFTQLLKGLTVVSGM